MEIEVDYVNEESTKENIVLRSRLQSQPQPQYSLAFLESLTMPQVSHLNSYSVYFTKNVSFTF